MSELALYSRVLGTGKPLLILHGLFGSGDNWLTLAKLYALEYEVHLIDARNHGQSPHDPHHTYGLMAADIVHYIQSHRLAQAHVVGHSMGGKTLMEILRVNPQLVDKAIVVDIAPRYYEVHHTTYIEAMRAVSLDRISSRSEAESILQEHIHSTMEVQFLMKGLYRTPEGTFAWRFNLEGIASQIHHIGEELRSEKPILSEVLFVKGAKSDYYIRPADETLIKSIFPKSTIVTLAGAGHWVQAEQPEAFYNVTSNFLKTTS